MLGVDGRGREVLTFLAGATVGVAKPWPVWVHSDEALVEVGAWLRRYHDAVADFVPPAVAQWRMSVRAWQPGDIVGRNDAAPYNAVWMPTSPTPGRNPGCGSRLVGFIDWDFAAPCSPLWDLAVVVFSWVPLHARDVVTAEGFTRFADRPRRLGLLLDSCGYTGSLSTVLEAVDARIVDHGRGVRELAAAGRPLFTRLVKGGVIDGLDGALVRLREDVGTLTTTT